MKYTDIQQANSEMQMLPLKGKDYAMVAERVTGFRKISPEGFIETEIIDHDGTTVMIKATVGFYEQDGTKRVLATGYAQEVRGKGMVNGTSYIENCETSAVGRALGFVGLGVNGGGICSAEELTNALIAQKQMKMEAKLFDTAPSETKINIRRKAIISLAQKKGFDEATLKSAPFSYCGGRMWDSLTLDDLLLVEEKLNKMKDSKEA